MFGLSHEDATLSPRPPPQVSRKNYEMGYPLSLWTFPCDFCVFRKANPSGKKLEERCTFRSWDRCQKTERQREWLASGFLIVRVDEPVKRNGCRGGVRVLMKFKHGPTKRINYASTPSVSGLVACALSKNGWRPPTFPRFADAPNFRRSETSSRSPLLAITSLFRLPR